jgi:hypothetical protein
VQSPDLNLGFAFALNALLNRVDKPNMGAEKPLKTSGQAGLTSNRRIYRRRPQDALECNYGPVLDLSASGMRFIGKKMLSGPIEVSIMGKGIEIKLKAKVVRCKKLGFRCYESAVQFLDDREIKRIVDWIAFWSANRRAG